MSRMVRRVHDEDTGKYGNDTKLDLWHDTAGDYKGLDRFGRIIDMKFTDFSGSAVDFARLKYTYDRNSNRLTIEDSVHKANSQSFTYDHINRLTDAKRGILDSGNLVQKSDVAENFNMDLLGNFTSAAGGIKVNSTGTSTVAHAVNATNEITTLGIPNASGAPKLINEPFTTSLSSFWIADKGTWSISSSQVNVDTLTSGDAVLLADAKLDLINYELKVTFPTSSSTNKAGLVFAHDGANSYYAVVLNRSTNKLALYKITSGSWGSALIDIAATIADSTQYTIKVVQRQMSVDAWLSGQSGVNFSYSSSTDLGVGKSGLYSDKTGVLFDDYIAASASALDPKVPRIGGSADSALSSGALLVNGSTRPGEAVVEKFSGSEYTAQVDVNTNGGSEADLWIHYTDANNGYRVRSYGNNELHLDRIKNGQVTNLYQYVIQGADGATLAVKYVNDSGYKIKVYVNSSLKFTVTESQLPTGGVALSGPQPLFDNLKIGTDGNHDGDLNDVDDTLIVSESFDSTDTTVSYDKAGNLIDDGRFQYQYDAWHRLVKVRSAQSTSLTIQTAEFDGLGRRIKKVVTNSGEHDGTTVFYFDGQKIIETRHDSTSNGSMVQQFIHGTRYVDELIQIRVKDQGDLYVHQDANWNVTGLTDLGGSVVERYIYTPYGELTVHQETGYGDRDGDYDVDSTDKGTVGSTCTGTVTGACRILDLDFDGDYDSTDAIKFDALTQGLARHPGKTSTGADQPFAHQGLLYEPETVSYQNRARQYDGTKRRFLQTDPLARSHPRSGYRDGLSSYLYLRANPLRAVDAHGAWATVTDHRYGEGAHVNVRLKIVFWGFGVNGANPQYEQDLQTWNVPAANGKWVYKGRPPLMHVPQAGQVHVSQVPQSCRPVHFVFEAVYWSDLIAGVGCNGLGNPPDGPANAFTTPEWAACFEQTLGPYDVSVWVAPPACPPDGYCKGGEHSPDGGAPGQQTGSDRLWINHDFMFNYQPESHGLSHEIGHTLGLLSYGTEPGVTVPRPPGLVDPMMQGGILPRSVAHVELRNVLRNTPPYGNWNMCQGP